MLVDVGSFLYSELVKLFQKNCETRNVLGFICGEEDYDMVLLILNAFVVIVMYE